MKLDNAIVLVTGANRGIGLALAPEALARGALKVCAEARTPADVTLAGVHAIRLEVARRDRRA
jgi:NAD(P)-dependent dehydrogenase (short-subunit alcohol dehydrogenase family)